MNRSVPYNVRVALQDTTLPRGGGPDGTEPIAVAKGMFREARANMNAADYLLTGCVVDTPIGYSTFILQRREDLYPPASAKFPHYLEFAPERWDSWTPTPWTFVPFNGGPRICIGEYTQLLRLQGIRSIGGVLTSFRRPEFRVD